MELESECQAKAGIAQDAQGRASKLTADNVKLYEKIRYLQSLITTANSDAAADASSQAAAMAAATGTATASGVRARLGGPAVPYAATVDEDFEKPYNRLYSESLDPFVDFSRREKARRYANLSAAEKITLTSSRLVLANKFARTAVLIYVLVLHLLVVATLWHFGHVSHRGCGDHENHLFDGATLGPPSLPADGATPRERLMERFMPSRLRGFAAANSTNDALLSRSALDESVSGAALAALDQPAVNEPIVPPSSPHTPQEEEDVEDKAEPRLVGEAPVATEGHGDGEQPSEGSPSASELEAAESPSSPAADAS